MRTKKCPCGETIEVPEHLWVRKKYCSKPCLYKYRVRPSGLKYDIKVKNKAWFKKKDKIKPTKKGYLRRRINGKMTRLHRHIMEQHLGRKLSSEEIVHHKDGNKLNNNISNLVVMTNAEHTRLHKKTV